MAAIFAVAMLVCAHVAGISGLQRLMPLPAASAAVAGIDLLLALVAMLLAGRNGPGAEEREAALLRDAAIEGVRRDLAWTTLLPSLIAMVRRFF